MIYYFLVNFNVFINFLTYYSIYKARYGIIEDLLFIKISIFFKIKIIFTCICELVKINIIKSKLKLNKTY